MSNPGDLRHRFILEAPNDIPDGGGGAQRSYQMIATFWAQLTPFSLNQRTEDGARQSRATHRLRLRARQDVTTEHRLRLGTDRLFEVLAYRHEEPGYMSILIAEIRP